MLRGSRTGRTTGAWRRQPRFMVIDPSATSFEVQLYQDGWPVADGVNAVVDGIRRGSSASLSPPDSRSGSDDRADPVAVRRRRTQRLASPGRGAGGRRTGPGCVLAYRGGRMTGGGSGAYA